MKSILLTLILTLSLPVLSQATVSPLTSPAEEALKKKEEPKGKGRAIYDKYSDMKGVEAVYISSAMFKMIGRLPEFDAGDADDVDLSKVVKHLKGMYILDIEDNKNAAKELARDVNSLVEKDDYELIMEAKEDGEVTKMYTLGDETTVYSFIIVEADSDETTFICIDGVIPREALQEAIAKAAED